MASLLAALLVVMVRAQVASEGGYGGLRQAPLEALLTALCGPPLLAIRRCLSASIEAKPLLLVLMTKDSLL